MSCRPRPSGRKRPGHTLPEAARRIVALVAESTSGAHRIVEFIGVADGIARQKSSLHASPSCAALPAAYVPGPFWARRGVVHRLKACHHHQLEIGIGLGAAALIAPVALVFARLVDPNDRRESQVLGDGPIQVKSQFARVQV